MINLNKLAVGLDGKEIEGAYIGKIAAQALISTPKGDALKFWYWATKMYQGESLDLDPTDTQILMNFIKDNETMSILVKAQALECFK
jgi:hypothetical protein